MRRANRHSRRRNGLGGIGWSWWGHSVQAVTAGCQRVDAQSGGPSFVWPAAAFGLSVKSQITHRVSGDELVLTGSKLCLTVNSPPGARVEVSLMQNIAVGKTSIERYNFRSVGVAVNDVLRTAIAEILLG